MASSGIIPAGTYRGKLVKVGELQVAGENDTPFYAVECVITEDGEYKNRRLSWDAWMGPNSRRRTYQAFQGSGCAFKDKAGNDDPENFDGLGTIEQDLQIEHETYTPKATDAEPNPAERTVAKVAFVNNGPMGRKGKPVDEAKKRALLDSFKADLVAARTGQSGPDAQGNEVGKDGVLRDKKGNKLY